MLPKNPRRKSCIKSSNQPQTQSSSNIQVGLPIGKQLTNKGSGIQPRNVSTAPSSSMHPKGVLLHLHQYATPILLSSLRRGFSQCQQSVSVTWIQKIYLTSCQS